MPLAQQHDDVLTAATVLSEHLEDFALQDAPQGSPFVFSRTLRRGDGLEVHVDSPLTVSPAPHRIHVSVRHRTSGGRFETRRRTFAPGRFRATPERIAGEVTRQVIATPATAR